MYNVPVAIPNRLLFNITTTIKEWESNSVSDPTACGDKTLEICVRYVGSGGETGMANVEVKMVSGYVPHEQSLNRFQDGNSIGLKRFDKYKPGQPLSLYFDKVSSVKPAEIFVKETKDAASSKAMTITNQVHLVGLQELHTTARLSTKAARYTKT
eukprot:XP_011665741.1 PREDICTED: uncharacterized protein LOC105438989 [Strongylocentrotus purpuratus]